MKLKKTLPLVLATGLPFLPMARAVLPVVQSRALAPAWAIVLRVAAGAVALLGNYHAVSGATAISGSRSINAVVGTPFARRLTTSGQTAHSWSADTAPLRSAVYPLAPGLYLTNRTGIIGGIPSDVATADITISGWEKSGNRGSRISAVFRISVTAPGSPAIAREPQNLRLTSGQDAVFSVAANGVEPLSYQWQLNGVPLAGETSAALSVSRAQPAHAGAYSVVVTNVAGAITSSVATLTVKPDLVPPVVTISSPGAARTFVTSNTFRLAGQARDNVGLSNVGILPASGEAILATGTTNWSAWVDLAPGTNHFRVKAVDFSGTASDTNTLRAIVFIVTSPLTLSNTGSGSIIGANNGQPLAVGRGVRFVQVWSGQGGGSDNWDNHGDIPKELSSAARKMDLPAAGLLMDLKARGLLEDTLLVWTTEFGRMPFTQGNTLGRDHNGGTFVSWFAGAGVNPGVAVGQSDEWSWKAVEGVATSYDFHATILHLLGINHEQLTFRHSGIDRRLTDVHGHVVKEILA